MIIEIIAQISAVIEYHQGNPSVIEPILGPTASASHITALFAQKTFERSFLSDKSAKIEFPIDILPQVIPSRTREKKITSTGRTINHNILISGTK